MTENQVLGIIKASFPNRRSASLAEAAEILGIKPATIRRAYCVDGHYMGVVPEKLPNGRLLICW